MLDQPLTPRQAIAILMLFCFGSSVVMGVSTGVAQDAWISLIVAVAFTVPVMLVYARIISLNPGVDLFTALNTLLGRVFGKLAAALMTWYALHLCALVMRNFSEFIQVSSILETPQLAVLSIMLLTVCVLARSGAKALGKWAIATIPMVLSFVVLTVVLSINVMQFNYALPILNHSVGEIAKDAFQVFTFPFAETVVFLGVADFIRPGDSPRKMLLGALLASGGVLVIVILRNMLVLGPEVVAVEFFPSYASARIINLGDFISRIEGSISINFTLAGVTKITLCLITASRGMASLFGVKNWRALVFPMGLTAMMLATILYGNIMEMFGFVKYYPYYAIPFEIAVPVAAWIASEVHARRRRRAEAGG